MKKTIIALILAILAIAVLASCDGASLTKTPAPGTATSAPTSSSDKTKTPSTTVGDTTPAPKTLDLETPTAEKTPTKEPAKKAVRYEYERTNNDDEYCTMYITINGIDENEEVVWTYRTVNCLISEKENLAVIGDNSGMIYVLENGRYDHVIEGAEQDGGIFTIDLETGKEIWRNRSCDTASVSYVFDSEGTLYYSGCYAPLCAALDKNGVLLWVTEKVDDGAFWSERVELDGELVFIYFSFSEDGSSYRTLDKKTGHQVILGAGG